VFFLFPSILVANVVMTLLPVAAAVTRHSAVIGAVAGGILILGSIAAWQLPQDLKGQVLVGYYVWTSSMTSAGLLAILFSFADHVFVSAE
jgi:hypothetical protein